MMRVIFAFAVLFFIFPAYSQPMDQHKLVVYQIFTRLFGNNNLNNQFNGTRSENGVGKFNDINKAALKSIKELGVSHVWYTGVIEHATMSDFEAYGVSKDHPQVVKGIAGSPYAIKDYYDVNPDLAVDVQKRMVEFESLIKRSHETGLKVIIDFVPNHVARSYRSDSKPKGVSDFGENDDTSTSFSPKNNFYYIPKKQFVVPADVEPPVDFDKPYYEYPARATGNDVFSERPHINDWFETVKLNYGVDYTHGKQSHFSPIPDTWHKMKNILLFWANKGVDGFRCDMAEMVPVAFWQWVTQEVKSIYPHVIFIAEIYNPNAYKDYIFKGGFDYLYDKVGLYDALRRLMEGHGNANDITAVWQNESGEFSEKMLRFLENHDEQRIASPQFASSAQKGLLPMALSTFLHQGPVMLYFGQELGVLPDKAEGFQGNDGRTTIFDYWGVPEIAAWNNNGKWNTSNLSDEQKKLRQAYCDIISFGTKHNAIKEGQFYDLQYVNKDGQSLNYDASKLYSFIRYTPSERLLFVFNFDHNLSYDSELYIPSHAWELMGINNEKVKISGDFLKKTIAKDEKIELHISPYSYQVFNLN